MTKAEWKTYACEIPAQKYGNTFRLESIYHVTHAHTALRIVDDGQISRGLVYDKSKLNITRRTVVWVSPNHWHNGSRYGTVKFEFDWKTLVEGKKFYWVEAMTGYSPPAFRFFLTNGNVDGLPPLTQYDPASDVGPLRLHDGEWWWNGNYTGEIMVDDDLSLADCKAVSFTNHHQTYCNIGHSHCTELGTNGDLSAARVMAYLLTTGRETADHAFIAEGGQLSGAAEHALNNLSQKLGGWGELKGPIEDAAAARHILKGALAELALGRRKDAKRLAALLASTRLCWTTLQDLILEHFQVASRDIQEGIDV